MIKPTTFLVSLSLAAVLAASSSVAADKRNTGTGPNFKGPVGLQLYSFRDAFSKDVPGTLDRVREYGFKWVETAGTYNLEPKLFRKLLEDRGLEAVAGHFPFERFRTDLDGVARDAEALRLKYAGCAWIPHEGDFDETECRQAIEVFNRAGEALAKKGIKFFYHTHGYEFQAHGDGTLFDLMMKETNPKVVTYEMDIFWVVHPGQDPAKLLRKYSGRWELMHLKDMKKGTPTGLLTGKSDVTNDVALGTGQIDLRAVLREAQRSGVKYSFIEDESPTVAEQVPQSLRYLEQAAW